MSSGARILLDDAKGLAVEVFGLLSGTYERFTLAGSIRRQTPTVGDIEVLVEPAVLRQRRLDLFGSDAGYDELNLVDDRVAALIETGVFSHRLDKNGRPALGSKYKRLTYRDFGLDLFCCIPGSTQQWGVLTMIRTGPSNFSHQLVTPVSQGGWMPAGMRCRNGALWRDGVMVETPTELDVFRAIGREYVKPEDRG